MITIMLDFVGWQFAGDELTELENDVTELESLRVELASYFCEDVKTFQLDECIRLFSTFFDSFIRASQVHTHGSVRPLSVLCILESRQRLRSSSIPQLVVPCMPRSTIGDRAFTVAARRAWNSLPDSLHRLSSLEQFKKLLKTHLFKISFAQQDSL